MSSLNPARAKASWRLFGLDGGMHGTWEDDEERRPRVGECQKWELGLPSAKTPPTSSAPPTYPLLMVSNLGQEGLVTGAAGGQNRGVGLGRKGKPGKKGGGCDTASTSCVTWFCVPHRKGDGVGVDRAKTGSKGGDCDTANPRNNVQ